MLVSILLVKCFQFCQSIRMWGSTNHWTLWIKPKHKVDVWFTKASPIFLVATFFVCVCLTLVSSTPYFNDQIKVVYSNVCVCIFVLNEESNTLIFCNILTWDLCMNPHLKVVFENSLNTSRMWTFFFIFYWIIKTYIPNFLLENKAIW
jgi:hypothetical protein